MLDLQQNQIDEQGGKVLFNTLEKNQVFLFLELYCSYPTDLNTH